ncbi:hypothetical protein DFJ63DRAFT_323418 [Scheffersomyces coipomensis]|uniref:uncharacterized protein n=1 Tax=Scheffersomyces coipomensis TaxID=1788519 RepID=UPI00315DDDDF
MSGSTRDNSFSDSTANGNEDNNNMSSSSSQLDLSIYSTSEKRRKSSRISQKATTSEILTPTLSASPIIQEKPGSNRISRSKVSGVIQNGGHKEFVEPPLPEPTPIYTGFPLETFPNAKIKKESYWPIKVKKSNKSSTSTSRENSTAPQLDNDIDSTVEELYSSKLETQKSNNITEPSAVRTPLKLIIRKTSKSRSRTPRQAKRAEPQSTSPLRSSKRVKIISPKKTASTNLAPATVTNNGHPHEEDDPTKDNDDFCSSCGGPGIFICCETCPKSFHFTCCDPPLEEAPEDDWFCRECIVKRDPTSMPNWDHVGIFGNLLNQQERRNPKVFHLPKNLRENTFLGVTTDDHGDYIDDTIKPELSYTKANGSQIPGCNKNIDLEIESLYNKDGRPYLCHKCGESGLNHRILTHCDYCPLVWHIDCLNEPIFGPKTIGSKWRCPNHVEELLPTGMFKFRHLKNATVVDPSIQSNFLNIALLSNIIIKHDSQPLIKEDQNPSLQEYKQFEMEDFSKEDSAFSNKDQSLDGDSVDEYDEVHPNFKLPDYFQTSANSVGVTAKASNRLTKYLNITTPEESGELSSFIYRIPEKSILIDFFAKVKSDNEKSKIINTIQEYDALKRIEENEDERNLVDSLVEIKSNPSTGLNLKELVNIAFKESNEIKQEEEEATNVEDLSKDELKDLLYIKKLMELKGKESLLKFLQS